MLGKINMIFFILFLNIFQKVIGMHTILENTIYIACLNLQIQLVEAHQAYLTAVANDISYDMLCHT